MSIAGLIIERHIKSDLFKLNKLRGFKNWCPGQSDFDALGKSEFMAQAAELEDKGLIKVKWYDGKSEIKNICYSTEIFPVLYEMEGKTPPWEEIKLLKDRIAMMNQRVRKDWIAGYYEYVLKQLDKGNIPENIIKPGFLDVINGLDKLSQPVYKKIFSKNILNDSKMFQNNFQDTIIRIAKDYNNDIDDAMEDSDVLKQIYINEYSQQLYIKGNLRVMLDGNELHLENFRYGIHLNSQTLKQLQILPSQKITRVITIENQANFEIAEYEEGTLYIYTHGFFSPKECEFLKLLREVLTKQEISGKSPVSYWHSSDLDYGGVRIFSHIRKNIFPEVRPLNMDEETYIRYCSLGYGTPLSKEALGRLPNIKEPLLKGLIECMIREKKGIEQECFLTGEIWDSYDAVLFDFDYTLGDSTEGIVQSVGHAMEKMGYGNFERQAVINTIGLSLEETFRKLTGVSNTEKEALFVSLFKEKANDVMTVNTKFLPGAVETLQMLKEKNIRTGIVTTKYHFRIEEILNRFDKRCLIDVIVGADDVENTKPAPDGLLLAVSELGLKKECVLYVGDSFVDARAAESAGIDFMGVMTGTTTREEFMKYPAVRLADNLEFVCDRQIN